MTMSLPHTAVIQNVLPLSPLSPSNTNIFSSSEYTPEDLENLQREHFLRRREASKKEKLSHLTLGHSVPRMIKCWTYDFLMKHEIWYALSQVTHKCPSESVPNMIEKVQNLPKTKTGCCHHHKCNPSIQSYGQQKEETRDGCIALWQLGVVLVSFYPSCERVCVDWCIFQTDGYGSLWDDMLH